MACKYCKNGFLGNEYGQVECVNGVLIDIDTADEGWQGSSEDCVLHAYWDDEDVACPECNKTGADCVPASANARLIAAAPELLEIAKRLNFDWWDHPTLAGDAADVINLKIEIVGTSFEDVITVGDLKALRAAITKATGEK